MTKTHLKRLQYLLDNISPFLDKKTVVFDMSAWILLAEGEKTKKNPCGTVCCAWGSAGLMPYFQKIGVKIEYDYMSPYVVFSPRYAMDKKSYDNQPYHCTLKDIEVVFGLTEEEVHNLFIKPNNLREFKAAVRKLLKEKQLSAIPQRVL